MQVQAELAQPDASRRAHDVERRLLLGHEQDGLARRHRLGDQVRDRLRLARPRRPLDHQELAGLRPATASSCEPSIEIGQYASRLRVSDGTPRLRRFHERIRRSVSTRWRTTGLCRNVSQFSDRSCQSCSVENCSSAMCALSSILNGNCASTSATWIACSDPARSIPDSSVSGSRTPGSEPVADPQLLEQALVRLGVAALLDLQRTAAATPSSVTGSRNSGARACPPRPSPLERAEREEEVVRAGFLDHGPRAALDAARAREVRRLGAWRRTAIPCLTRISSASRCRCPARVRAPRATVDIRQLIVGH